MPTKASNDIERRSIPLGGEFPGVEIREDSGKPVITGYAAMYGRRSQDLGGFTEEIRAGAFDAILGGCDCRALVNHDPSLILGRTVAGTLKLTSDHIGLRYEISPPDSQLARHYIESIKRGDISGSSFAFTADDDEWRMEDGKHVRVINQFRSLLDVGPVTYPAYTDTRVSARSLDSLAAQEATAETPNEDLRTHLMILKNRLRLI